MQSVTSQFYMKPIGTKPDDKPTRYSTWETLKGYSILWVETKYWKWQWFNHIYVLPHAAHMGCIVCSNSASSQWPQRRWTWTWCTIVHAVQWCTSCVQVYTLFTVYTKFWVAATWWFEWFWNIPNILWEWLKIGRRCHLMGIPAVLDLSLRYEENSRNPRLLFIRINTHM